MKGERFAGGTGETTRREFLTGSAAVAASGLMLGGPFASGVFAGGTDTIKVGLIGCGGRGSGAAEQIVRSAPNVRLHALGDLYPDRLEASRARLESLGPEYRVAPERCFTGFDAYQHVLATDVNVVILATPPGFRPQHLRAAVLAGKHIFAEKPVAVCPAGVRSVIETARLAEQKGLAIVAGTQRRHQASYVESIRRIHEGAIGKVVAATCYWNQGGIWTRERKPDYSDVEWQTRNWYYFCWLSGDHIVEQHVHNLDVMNWVLDATPVKCMGMGGRQARTEPIHGNIYDHFTIEYEYPGGVRVTSMCRQIDGTAGRVSERVVGTDGVADPGGRMQGSSSWQYDGETPNPYVQELTDLIASIRSGKPLNEGRRVAESTLTAIMGRMSAYTGQEVTWEQAMGSRLDLQQKELRFGPLEADPVPVPGKTPLV